MNNKVTTRLLVIAVLALGMVGSAAGATVAGTDNSTVTVTIGTKTAIDISPAALNFGTINPGSESGTASITGGEVVGTVELENTGSTNITNIWLNASTPSSNPFGTGLASNYDAGNFLQVKTGNGEITGVAAYDNFTFVNRKEFNESNDLAYIFTQGEGSAAQNWSYGRFRAGEQEYFWAVNVTGRAAGTGSCVTTGSDNFRVGMKPRNRTATGSNDFRTGSGEYYSYDVATDNGVSYASNVELNGSVLSGHRTYDVVLNCGNPTWATRTHFNVDAGGTADLAAIAGTNTEYLLSGTNGQESAFQPGEHFSVNVSMQVPLGVAETSGSGINGFLRVFANTA